MNDRLEPMPVQTEPAPTAVVGAVLRAARENRGLAIEQLADTLKVPRFKLEALEADRFDLLSDPVFARALVASVCRALKIDAGPVLARLPRPAPAPIRTDDKGINATFRDSGGGLGRGWVTRERKAIGVTVLALLAAALAIGLWPHESMDTIAPAGSPAPEQSITGTPAVNVATSPDPDTAPLPTAIASAVMPAGSMPEASGGTARVAALPLLTIKALGTSWVQVTDAHGVQQLHKTVQAGEVLSVAGELPLSVVLGRADAVEVSVRNQALNLRDVSKNNVARFEVK